MKAEMLDIYGDTIRVAVNNSTFALVTFVDSEDDTEQSMLLTPERLDTLIAYLNEAKTALTHPTPSTV